MHEMIEDKKSSTSNNKKMYITVTSQTKNKNKNGLEEERAHIFQAQKKVGISVLNRINSDILQFIFIVWRVPLAHSGIAYARWFFLLFCFVFAPISFIALDSIHSQSAKFNVIYFLCCSILRHYADFFRSLAFSLSTSHSPFSRCCFFRALMYHFIWIYCLFGNSCGLMHVYTRRDNHNFSIR